MSNNKKYNGIWPVLVTPYNDDLSIDIDGYRKMLEWYMTFDIGGLYANCQSSEMTELSDDERLLIIAEAVKIADGKIPVAATGNFGENIDRHIEFSKKVEDTGVDIVMLTVQDNGIGFDPEIVPAKNGKNGGFGLFSIHERMSDMGGTFDIMSAPDQGCTAILKVPIAQAVLIS